MPQTPITLVTGANQGIGLQIAKDLAAAGHTVLLGARDAARGEAAAATIGSSAHAVQLDVTDAASIAAAAEKIRRDFGRLDVLVNNAAISHTDSVTGETVTAMAEASRASIVSLDEVRAVWETNVFGVLAVTQAMLPLLRAGTAPHIVNVSSTMGSLSKMSDPAMPYRAIFGPVYPASKTALNAITVALAIDLEAEGIKVNAVCPGYTKTNLNNYSGTKSVEDGARQPVRLALMGADAPTGTFSSSDGPEPW